MERKKVKCPICHGGHEIDSTGWVQSCIGYYPKEFFQLDTEGLKNMIETWKVRFSGR